MKKYFLLLTSLFFFFACDNTESDEINVPEYDETESTGENTLTSTEGEDSETTDEEEELSEEPRVQEVNGFEFVMPSEQEAADNEIEEVVLALENSANIFVDLAIEGEITPIWSGIVDQDPTTGAQRGAFLLANDSEESIENIQFSLQFEDEMGNIIWSDREINLTSEEFGSLENEQIKLFILEVPSDAESDFNNMMNNDLLGVPSIDNLEYETL